MKKILCLCLAICLVFGLCGCFGGSNDNIRGEVNNGTNEGNNEPQFSLGTNANNTYTNDFLGIGCTLPADWVFYSDEQMLQMNNITSEVLDEETAKLLENATIIYDMYAVHEENGSCININLEKLNLLQSAVVDIRQTLESQIDAITTAYQNMGYTDISIVYEKITVDGKAFDSLNITAKIYGIDFYGTVFAFKKGTYLANVSVTTLQTETDALLGYFTVQ